MIYKPIATTCCTLKNSERSKNCSTNVRSASTKSLLPIIGCTIMRSFTPQSEPEFYVGFLCLARRVSHSTRWIDCRREKTIVISDVALDPTLPRTTAVCEKCQGKEAVYFQSTSNKPDEAMSLYFVCCNPACAHRWKE